MACVCDTIEREGTVLQLQGSALQQDDAVHFIRLAIEEFSHALLTAFHFKLTLFYCLCLTFCIGRALEVKINVLDCDFFTLADIDDDARLLLR